MTRRFLAAALLLALSWLIAAPVWAGGRSACAMCAKHCCCAPKFGGERCAVRRACGTEDTSDPAASGLWTPALVPVRPVVGEPSGDEATAPAAVPGTLRLSLAPPDHPPRSTT